jgi:hypothetical protein
MGTYGRGTMVAWYANLWNTPNKRIKNETNVTFFVYFDTIRYLIEHMPHISGGTVETCKEIAQFKADMCHMYVQEKKDPSR